MSDKPGAAEPAERLSLRRWSQRKLDAAREKVDPAKPPAATVAPAEAADTRAATSPPNVAAASLSDARVPLPAIESLTIDSDYMPFFQSHVAESTRRAALKQLFRDPRFNIMDGLDSLVGDYTKSDPIPPEMLKELVHARHIFNPPRTMVNAEGHVVDVVEAEPRPPAVTAETTAAGAVAATTPAEQAPATAAAEDAPAPAPDAAAGDATGDINSA